MLGHHCPKSCFLAGNECLLEGARGGQALAGCTASRVWKAESPKVCIKAGPSLLQPRERRLGEKGREHSPPPKDRRKGHRHRCTGGLLVAKLLRLEEECHSGVWQLR